MCWPLDPGQSPSSPVSRRSKHDHQRPLRRSWHQQRYQACNWHQHPHQACTATDSPTRSVAYSPTRSVAYRNDERRHARETKPSFKTTELIVYLLSVFGVLIASWVVDVPSRRSRVQRLSGLVPGHFVDDRLSDQPGWSSPAAATRPR